MTSHTHAYTHKCILLVPFILILNFSIGPVGALVLNVYFYGFATFATTFGTCATMPANVATTFATCATMVAKVATTFATYNYNYG